MKLEILLASLLFAATSAKVVYVEGATINSFIVGMKLLTSMELVTIIVMIVALIALAGRWLCKKRLPPLADAGVIETVRALTTGHAPWFILELARGRPAGSRVFRLRLPMMEHVVVIADPELRRTIESNHHMDKPCAEKHPTSLSPPLTLTLNLP